MSWEQEYFQRVRPVVGSALRERTLWVWNPARAYISCEALARTGLTRQHWFGAAQPLATHGALCRSLGQHHAGRTAADALHEHIRDHNRFESGFELSHSGDDPAELRARLATQSPDLLLACGDGRSRDVLAAAIDAGVPVVVSYALRTAAVGSVHIVWHPRSSADPTALLSCAGELDRLPVADTDRLERHIDQLESQSTALALCRWLLAPMRPPRPDLEGPLLERGHAILLRGEPAWPWAVSFAPASSETIAYCARDVPAYHPPAALLRDQRLLVVGLGTASLLCAEAGLLTRDLVLVDQAKVSPYNPVRQIYGTEWIGEAKGPALARILAARWRPDAAAEVTEAPDLRTLRSGDLRIASAELRASRLDPDGLAQLRRILDQTRPTLAVVGMGRSKDDNFAVTAELRRRSIRHITPTAFPGVTHYKHILTDGGRGPCYDCLQGHLAIDGGSGPTLQQGERELFYGGTQPATLAETLPSAHSLLRLCRDLALPPAARPAYLQRELAAERNCLVGANRTELTDNGWLYGVDRPFRMVAYGIEHLVGSRARQRCPCGRVNLVSNVLA